MSTPPLLPRWTGALLSNMTGCLLYMTTLLQMPEVISGRTPEDGPKMPWPIAKSGVPFTMGLALALTDQEIETVLHEIQRRNLLYNKDTASCTPIHRYISSLFRKGKKGRKPLSTHVSGVLIKATSQHDSDTKINSQSSTHC